MVEPIGVTGLAISIVDGAIMVLKFIDKWIDDSKQFGPDVRAFKTRLSTETARLDSLSEFLDQKSTDGKPRLEQLSVTFQRATKGMVQELQIKLASYEPLVKKYKIGDLKRGFDSTLPSALDGLSITDTAQLKEDGEKEAKERQKEATFLETAAWGLFQKKKISALLVHIKTWNDQLQSLLLCSLLFGNGPKVSRATPVEIWQGLRLSHSITLQKLISESTQAPSEVFHENWVLKPSRLLRGTEFDTRVQELVREGTSEPVFVESKSFELRRHAAGPSELIMGRLTNLVKILSQPNASQSGFNTLQCVGVIPQEMPSQRTIIKRFAFVFRLPFADPKAGLTISNIPISLKNAVLSNTEHRPTLGERFKLAYTLAETVLNLHSVDWLHKSIRSENILLPRKDSKVIYSTPYLVGFEFSRAENERSTTERDDILERDIYRHPDRQGQPEDRFMVLHDIYSLGVTLLEIGIWRPVLGFDKRFERMTADEIKICLEKHAEDRLPHYMGGAYTAAVLHCLRGTLLEKSEHPSVNNASLDASQREQVQVSLLENVIGGIESGTKLS